jgi:sialic acid synthase SpsE
VIKINEKIIAKNQPVYIIAEIGSNHNQNIDLALEMIEKSAAIGVDAVKFQSIKYDKLYNPNLESKEFSEWIKQIELDETWYPKLAEKAKTCNVDFISAPTYIGAIDLLESCGVPAYKIASPQVQGNLELVEEVAKTGKPLLMSMGYASYDDISNAISISESVGNHSIIPLHCVSQYPVVPENVNLRFIQTLKYMSGYDVGFSDHSLGHHIAIAAVAMGACVIEKHVTKDRSQNGPDHHFSMTFDEFSLMVKNIRDIELALGNGVRLSLGKEEESYREFVELKITAARPLVSGEKLQHSDFSYIRSNLKGLSKKNVDILSKGVAKHSINKGDLIHWDDVVIGGGIDE